jgi:hypothetical protein
VTLAALGPRASCREPCCGAWRLRRSAPAALGACGAWRLRRLAPAALGACGAWRLRRLAPTALGACGAWRLQRLAPAALGTCGAWRLQRLAPPALDSCSAWRLQHLALAPAALGLQCWYLYQRPAHEHIQKRRATMPNFSVDADDDGARAYMLFYKKTVNDHSMSMSH